LLADVIVFYTSKGQDVVKALFIGEFFDYYKVLNKIDASDIALLSAGLGLPHISLIGSFS